MRRRLLSVLLVTAMLSVGSVFVSQAGQASPADEYTGTHFGAGNTPRGCENDVIPTTGPDDTSNECYHQKTDLNGLDTNYIDVLILAPVSPFAERDARIMRQAVEMWDGGIQYLAPQMGLDWMQNTKFTISTQIVDFVGGTPIYTYPIVDPEIVVIAANPVGGAGIGIDPLASPVAVLAGQPIPPSGEGPCHGLNNPFDFEGWEAVPGFDHHHREAGTYTQDCGDQGGNICFAVNGGIDPTPDSTEVFSLFDLVAHEFGHCLSLGHVGDGGEGVIGGVWWGDVPTNDIMAYHTDPVALNKCVSTLDVESLATTQSRFIDTNGDGQVTAADKLEANDPEGQPDEDSPFQTQHPRDHLYASATGDPRACPQPDLGIVPGPRTDWTPEPVATSTKVLTVTSPLPGDTSADGNFTVTGTVEKQSLSSDPTEPTGFYDDADNDAKAAQTEILDLNVAVTADTVEARVAIAALPPKENVALSPTTYSLEIDHHHFDSWIYANSNAAGPSTFDSTAGAYVEDNWSSWDWDTNTVSFHIPRSYLASKGVTAPYEIQTMSKPGSVGPDLPDDDRAPDGHQTVGVANAKTMVVVPGGVNLQNNVETITFTNGEDPANTFFPEDSSAGLHPTVANGDNYTLDLGPTAKNVTLTLDWTDASGQSDLDLYVTGAAESGALAAGSNKPETVSFTNLSGVLNLEVDPFLIGDPFAGATYTLTAVVEGGVQPVDTDGDGVLDDVDACPNLAGAGANGCPIAAAESVKVYLDDAASPLASQDVDTSTGPDGFAIPVSVPVGAHSLRVEWVYYDHVVATTTVPVRHQAVVTGPDADSDGVGDSTDNCVDTPNADQANLDGDAKGDACDPDIDGDGHPNGKEKAHGSDPRDPNSVPAKASVAPAATKSLPGL